MVLRARKLKPSCHQMEQLAKSSYLLSLIPGCRVCGWDKGKPVVESANVGEAWHRAHAPYQGWRGTARARAIHMTRGLAGLHKPVQSNPWNTPCLQSNSCVGEHGWVLQGCCEVPGTGQRDSLSSRAAGVLFGDWDPAPLCPWKQPATQSSDSPLSARGSTASEQ